ncbi:SCO family protein [Flavobacteriaceae bacterium]|jgi:protein SCO1/2|nr:SCO family protein [Flavobacteriaceae bacterium]MDB4063634.1 SCO family protein [Flavobacteriaceae bacterium]MDC1392540.1 SCO family protein [Flavobacteriaceae bacterium]|tara:strand:- start:155 stop:859 length:705 start_codon:yes stop_codon:yes gene_type:complete
MQFFFKKYKIFLRVLLVVSTIILALFYDALKPKKVLPIYQPSMVNYELVDSTLQHVKKYHKIAPFSFENQNGKTITQDDYEGKIYIADFFFTTCPTICPKMTANMVNIQEEILNDSTVMLLSYSVTPKIDSVPQLKKYAIEKGVNDEKWNLLTGNKKEIYTMARKSYLVVKENGDGGPYDMIHTENFILVDPEKRIRGFYDGTDTLAMRELLIDLEILKDEFFPSNFLRIALFQ